MTNLTQWGVPLLKLSRMYLTKKVYTYALRVCIFEHIAVSIWYWSRGMSYVEPKVETDDLNHTHLFAAGCHGISSHGWLVLSVGVAAHWQESICTWFTLRASARSQDMLCHWTYIYTSVICFSHVIHIRYISSTTYIMDHTLLCTGYNVTIIRSTDKERFSNFDV
jgi:hypothetical protein